MATEHQFDLPVEKLLQSKLGESFTASIAEATFRKYQNTYEALSKYWRSIPASEPSLTDHSETHVVDVLTKIPNTHPNLDKYTGYELYLLAVAVLFHDTGNLFGRDDHQNKISEIFDAATNMNSYNATHNEEERRCIINIVSAHCGCATDGSTDTIAEKCSEPIFHGEHQVRLQELAAILRLTDEVCEGKHRTNAFLLNHGLITEPSTIYHQFSDSVTIRPQYQNRRIIIELLLDLGDLPRTARDKRKRIHEYLEFSANRISKLFNELQYASYYCRDYLIYDSVQSSLTCKRSSLRWDLASAGIELSTKILPQEYTRQRQSVLDRMNSTDLTAEIIAL